MPSRHLYRHHCFGYGPPLKVLSTKSASQNRVSTQPFNTSAVLPRHRDPSEAVSNHDRRILTFQALDEDYATAPKAALNHATKHIFKYGNARKFAKTAFPVAFRVKLEKSLFYLCLNCSRRSSRFGDPWSACCNIFMAPCFIMQLRSTVCGTCGGLGRRRTGTASASASRRALASTPAQTPERRTARMPATKISQLFSKSQVPSPFGAFGGGPHRGEKRKEAVGIKRHQITSAKGAGGYASKRTPR